jgi:hypothetical protein
MPVFTQLRQLADIPVHGEPAHFEQVVFIELLLLNPV